jgi:hypothetical protein
VLDYFHPADFHQLAQSCSMGCRTIHTGYSMNWVKVTSGCSFLDVARPGARNSLMAECGEELHDQLQEIPGATRLLLLPPAISVDQGAGFILFQRRCHGWGHAFFAESSSLADWRVIPSRYNFLARQHAEIQLVWTYEPEHAEKSAPSTPSEFSIRHPTVQRRKHEAVDKSSN